jgi:taurine dioxygenase
MDIVPHFEPRQPHFALQMADLHFLGPTYLEEPALGSILYAREVPAFGGDTPFANMYSAYDALSQGMKRMLAGMTAVHSARRAYSPRSSYFSEGQRSMKIRRSNAAEAEVQH